MIWIRNTFYLTNSYKISVKIISGAASTTAIDAGDHWVLNGTKVILQQYTLQNLLLSHQIVIS